MAYFCHRVNGRTTCLLTILAGVALFAGAPAIAAPVCSTGSDGIVVVGASATRVNVYYAAPDPTVEETIVPVGSTSIPVDIALGGQAANLHPSISPTIAAGDILIVAQMIGAEIDTTDNHSSTGDYGDGPGGLDQAGSLDTASLTAGQYEFVIATGPISAGAIPIEGAGVGNGLINEYVNSNVTTASLGFRRYQVVKVPQFTRLSLSGEIVSDRWNGRWGGISAINVRENLDLQGGSFNADGRGYRGGQFFPDRSDLQQGAVNGNFGFKGEGIAGLPQRLFSRVLLAEQPATNGEELGPAGYAGVDGLGPAGTAWTRDTGQGAPGNAGSGGGGAEDAGGGGGANYAAGGGGGQGVDGADTEGFGGAAFPQHFAATPDFLVMGGGGGASNGNDISNLDLTVSSGQAGGGVVFVRSVGIIATGGGSVSADGDSGGTAASEGGGGGGAGGTILVHTDNSTVDGFGFSAIGGNGGSSLQTLDGGGGGGSGGIIWLSETSAGGASFSTAGGAAGTGASGGAYNGTAGGAGTTQSIAPIAPFDCNFVTLGIAKALTAQMRVGTSGNVFDLEFTLTVENFSTNGAINTQVTDDLSAAFPNAVSITIQGVPDLDGFSAPATAYDGSTQIDLLAGTDTMPGNTVRTITYTVRVDFGNDTGPFSTQARVTSSQIAGGFAQVLDLSDAGLDPDADGDGDPSETIANGGDAEENDATPVVLDLTVDPAVCSFDPNPAFPSDAVTASCTGIEPGGSVTIPGMSCGTESGGAASCMGTASDIGSIPDITTVDAVGNTTTAPGDLVVLPDADADGIPDIIEGAGDSDGDGIPDAQDTDSDNDGISDDDEENSLPPLTGIDSDGEGIDDAIDVDETGGTDNDGDGIDDTFAPDDFDGDGLPDYRDTDSDNDRVPDILEGNSDEDGDLSPNYLDLDSDGDNVPDSVEADNVPDLLGSDADLDGIDDALDVDETGGADLDDNGVDDLLQPIDTDSDGTPDYLDLDSDADGLPDTVEGVVDTDGDGTGDWRDIDSDNDGALDSAEGPAGNDTDGDGTPDYHDLDSDNDGINDVIESGLIDADQDGLADAGQAPLDGGSLPDADGDGTPDLQEVDSDNDGTFDIAGTPDAGLDQNNDGRVDDASDTDGDGIADVVDGSPFDFGDRATGLPTDMDGDGIADAIEGTGDTDGDGLADFEDPDSDNDAIPDATEEMNQPPLTGSDSDSDGIDDAVDVDNTGGTDADGDSIDDAFNPLDSDGDGLPNYRDLDSDDDGIQDSFESNVDTDGDQVADYIDTDSDNDGIADFEEADNLPPESGNDADGDGIDDAFDVDVSGGQDLDANGFDDAFEPVDTDTDGLPDFRDIDSDGDAIPDAIEGTVDTDGDSAPDWRDTDSDHDGILDGSEGPLGADVDADGIDDAYDADVTGLPDVDGNGVVDDAALLDVDTDDDGTPDYRDLDSDNDSINDVNEAGQPDLDGDGLADSGSLPIGGAALPDSDSDGTPDFQDLDSDNDGTFDIQSTPDAAFDADADGRIDDTTDTDGDGIADAVDGMPGNFGDAVDSDNDGISDMDEGLLTNADTDGDGIPDYLDLDSDNDGIPDALETNDDADGDGVGNWRDADSDGDGIDDATEADRIPPLSDNDTDGDGLPDEVDVDNTGGVDVDGNGVDDALEPNDTDADGTPDFLDTDADGDSVEDVTEGSVDTDGDGTGDWRDTDSDNDGIPDIADSGDKDNDGIPDRVDSDEGRLETAVRGAGSTSTTGIAALLVVLIASVAMRRRAPVLLLGACFVVSSLHVDPAMADSTVCTDADGAFDGCWYAGGGLGLTHVDPEGQAGGWSTNDDRDSGWKLYGGYQFRPLWSIELSYVDGGEAGLGNVDPALEVLIPNATIDYATPSLMAVRWLNAPQSTWNAFAKLGISAIDNSASDPRIPFEKQTDVQLAAGVGAKLRFAQRWFVRGDIDFYDRDHYYAGLSVGGYFGAARRTVPAPVAEPTPAAAAVESRPAPAPPPPAPAPEPICEDVVTVLEGLTFENDSDQLTPASVDILERVVGKLSQSPSDTVHILAHTDSNGSVAYNLGLSVRRAQSVEDYLVRRGIAEGRLSSEGLGEARPVADNATPEGRARNRRVELVWSSEACR